MPALSATGAVLGLPANSEYATVPNCLEVPTAQRPTPLLHWKGRKILMLQEDGKEGGMET